MIISGVYGSGSYVILLISRIYWPNPAKGGAANMKDAIQQDCILNEDQILMLGSCVCQDLSSFTTEKYRTVAIPAIVNKEFNPVNSNTIH